MRSRIRNPPGLCGLAWSWALCPGGGAVGGPTRPVGARHAAPASFTSKEPTARLTRAGRSTVSPLWNTPGRRLRQPGATSLGFEERADTGVGMAGARHCPLRRLPAATLAHCFVSNQTKKPKKARITVSFSRSYRFILMTGKFRREVHAHDLS